MNKQLVIILFFFLFVPTLFSQEEKKTTAFVTIEFLSPSENSMIVKDNKLNFSFGMGIGLNLKTQFTESSALVYGLEFASTRRNFVVDGFSVFGSFSQFKFPIYYQYSLALDRKRRNSINLFMGTKVVVQQESRIGGSVTGFQNTNKQYEVIKKGGVFPLLTFGFGYDLKFKSNYFIGFEAGYNLGFMKAMEFSYPSEENTIEYSSMLTHINFKVLFPLNVNAR